LTTTGNAALAQAPITYGESARSEKSNDRSPRAEIWCRKRNSNAPPIRLRDKSEKQRDALTRV
jgi:hypothetical protein